MIKELSVTQKAISAAVYMFLRMVFRKAEYPEEAYEELSWIPEELLKERTDPLLLRELQKELYDGPYIDFAHSAESFNRAKPGLYAVMDESLYKDADQILSTLQELFESAILVSESTPETILTAAGKKYGDAYYKGAITRLLDHHTGYTKSIHYIFPSSEDPEKFRICHPKFDDVGWFRVDENRNISAIIITEEGFRLHYDGATELLHCCVGSKILLADKSSTSGSR